jgi:hypothetical protein
VEYWNDKLKTFKRDKGRWGIVGEFQVWLDNMLRSWKCWFTMFKGWRYDLSRNWRI